MSNYTRPLRFHALVRESFPDGTLALHYFESREDAERALRELSHDDRTYEIVDRDVSTTIIPEVA